ncbi:uncharacterized protein LOC141577579 [Camelus bactrianus]|uniref:Uncharacterized protein LOC141577579 n=1 Tax=Camelus bactrianus TaxID=9837 RepID=A0AC58QAJ6_CAMBA
MEGLAIEKPVNSTNGLHPKTTRNTPLVSWAGTEDSLRHKSGERTSEELESPGTGTELSLSCARSPNHPRHSNSQRAKLAYLREYPTTHVQPRSSVAVTGITTAASDFRVVVPGPDTVAHGLGIWALPCAIWELGGSGEAGEVAARTGVSDSEASTVTGQSLLQAAFLPRPSGSFPRARAERSPSTPQRERVAGPGPRGGPAQGGVGRLPAADPELLPPARRPRPAPSAAAPGGSGPAPRPPPGPTPAPPLGRWTPGRQCGRSAEAAAGAEQRTGARPAACFPASGQSPPCSPRSSGVLRTFATCGLFPLAQESSTRQVYMPSIRPEQSRRGGAGS